MGAPENRKELADGLRSLLGTKWTVHPDEPTLNEITKPTVTLRRIGKSNQATPGVRLVTYRLQLIAPQNTTDDKLDGLSDDMDNALDDLHVAWSGGDYGVWDDSNPVWLYTLTTITNREA